MGAWDLRQFWGSLTGITQRILAILFCLSINLELLLLHKVDHDNYPVLCDTIENVAGQFGHNGSFLPKLSTIYLQKVRKPDGTAEGELVLPSVFLELGNINQVQIWRISGSNANNFGNDLLWLARIRELKLFCSFCANDIYGICESAIQLESLTLVMTDPRFLIYYGPTPLPGEDINYAISLCANTLKFLEFRITGKRWFQDQIGSLGVLECLPRLKQLETLRTEIPLIYRSDDIHLSPVELVGKLPPNIASLELIEWPTYPPGLDHFKSATRHLCDSIFIALANNDVQLPNLRQIHFLCSAYNPCFDTEQLGEERRIFDDCESPISFTWAIDLLQTQAWILGHLAFTLHRS
ncbi:hypothetical protein F5B19DRAFT_491784 [Rostrohypoxylon terebratum]|nr:hypothetical protein F5B19DRAFT_491784 [Rostrohypoxylon terebratum]